MSPAPPTPRQFRVRLEDGTDLGTMTEERAVELIRKGVIERGDRIQRVGSERWRRADEVARHVFEEMERGGGDPSEASFIGEAVPEDAAPGLGGPLPGLTVPGLAAPPRATMGPAATPSAPGPVGAFGWALRAAILAAALAVVWLGIATVPMFRHFGAQSDLEVARMRADLAAQSVATFASSNRFVFDPKRDLDADLRAAQELLGQRTRRREAAAADAAAAEREAGELEALVARRPAAEKELAEVDRLFKGWDEYAALATARAKSEDAEADVRLRLGQITWAEYSQRRQALGIAISLASARKKLADQKSALEAELKSIGDAQANRLAAAQSKRVRTSRDLATVEGDLAQSTSSVQTLAPAAALWREHVAAAAALAESDSHAVAAGKGFRNGILWGGFGGIVTDGIIVGCFFLFRRGGMAVPPEGVPGSDPAIRPPPGP